MAQFHVLTASLALMSQLKASVERIARRDADLARQLRRAASSVPLNISEGNMRTGRDRTHLFTVALGSVTEARTALDVAVAWGYVDAAALADAFATIDRVRAMLWRLTR